VVDTNISKRAPPMSNAPSPKRRLRSGKDPGSITTSPSPLTRSVKASHAWTEHQSRPRLREEFSLGSYAKPVHAYKEAYPSSEELVVEHVVWAV